MFGCEDDDGDGYSNAGDDFDNNPTQWMDSDGDGYGIISQQGDDSIRRFSNDGSQWEDSDGDGYEITLGVQPRYVPQRPNTMARFRW